MSDIPIHHSFDKRVDRAVSKRLIPRIDVMPINPSVGKYGGPLYLPTNKDYGNFPVFKKR